MQARPRIIASLVTALVAGLLVAGCGEDQKADREAQAAARPDLAGNEAGAPAKRSPENVSQGDESGESEIKGPADRKLAEKQIRDVIARFFRAASRGDFGTACSLFVSGGTCESFFSQLPKNTGAFPQPAVSRIIFIEGGEEAIAEFSGLGRQVELKQRDGKWLLEEIPGF
jgi:hypothetical protein